MPLKPTMVPRRTPCDVEVDGAMLSRGDDIDDEPALL
jgi:hypothetical protein